MSITRRRFFGAVAGFAAAVAGGAWLGRKAGRNTVTWPQEKLEAALALRDDMDAAPVQQCGRLTIDEYGRMLEYNGDGYWVPVLAWEGDPGEEGPGRYLS